ncbi:uncharacterized protein LOC127242856 [Andrographis paniculata]|uniref:uncharacterized protein LOC127242856 n=1 Tax=Andrographis paniculata TaxID=175694 RepID=UPI0021E768D9|nr:uncharacterized protein LOC127242856 [Andrographis paniculata]
MDRAIVIHLPLIVMILALFSSVATHWVPRSPPPPITPPPLCASQFTLVNRACAMLPYMPGPPAFHPASVDEEESRRHHGHHHNHRSTHQESPEQQDCCRWLKEVDNVCVCDLLVRLPPFLTRPMHNYTVVVDDSCVVTFACGSRLVRV